VRPVVVLLAVASWTLAGCTPTHGKLAPFVPTPQGVVEAMLKLAEVVVEPLARQAQPPRQSRCRIWSVELGEDSEAQWMQHGGCAVDLVDYVNGCRGAHDVAPAEVAAESLY